MQHPMKEIQKNNPELTIRNAADSGNGEEAFRPFGRILRRIEGGPWLEWAEENLPIEEAAQYRGSIREMEEGEGPFGQVKREIFGGMPLQVGCCWGRNSAMNGMEFHKSSEVIGAQTPLVLILGRRQDVYGGIWESQGAQLFYLPAGTFAEIYSTSMHLAPCRVDPAGFRALIILPRGTNEPLAERPEITNGKDESQWLFAVNKWMICHPDSPQSRKGAWPGIRGENLRVEPADQ